jgi:hypothetical protein
MRASKLLRLFLGLVAILVVVQAGCATVPPSPERLVSTETSYGGGRAIQDYALAPGKVGDALREAMTDLKMTGIESGRDGAVYKVQAKTPDNRAVMATLRPHQGETRVAVRVGWFGDEPLSKALLERTGVRLGTRPPAAIPSEVPSAPSANPIFSRSAVPDEEMFRDVVEAPYRDRVIP